MKNNLKNKIGYLLNYLKSPIIILKFFIRNKNSLWTVYSIKNNLNHHFNALYIGNIRNKKSLNNIFNFRRNIHRLEKGLSNENTKKIFAESYILNTVEYLENDIENKTFDKSTLEWGISVLDLYFQSCEHNSLIKNAYNKYKECKAILMNSSDLNTSDKVPYSNNLRPELKTDFDSLYHLALRRRSIRQFTDKKVEPLLIEKAMQISALSPSACNRQSFKFKFFNNPSFVNKISDLAPGVSGFELPSIIVVVGSYFGYFDVRDFKSPIIDSSLAIMSFIFALETLGLSSLCINWPNLSEIEEEIRKLIELEDDEFVVMLIGIGYSHNDAKIAFSGKRSVSDILEINKIN